VRTTTEQCRGGLLHSFAHSHEGYSKTLFGKELDTDVIKDAIRDVKIHFKEYPGRKGTGTFSFEFPGNGGTTAGTTEKTMTQLVRLLAVNSPGLTMPTTSAMRRVIPAKGGKTAKLAKPVAKKVKVSAKAAKEAKAAKKAAKDAKKAAKKDEGGAAEDAMYDDGDAAAAMDNEGAAYVAMEEDEGGAVAQDDEGTAQTTHAAGRGVDKRVVGDVVSPGALKLVNKLVDNAERLTKQNAALHEQMHATQDTNHRLEKEVQETNHRLEKEALEKRLHDSEVKHATYVAAHAGAGVARPVMPTNTMMAASAMMAMNARKQAGGAGRGGAGRGGAGRGGAGRGV
jgi:hypothetical protein